MMFLHLKTSHVYEIVGLTVIEATMEPAVRYCPLGLPEHEFIRPASEFFDGRFKVFIPRGVSTPGYLDAKGRGQFTEPTDGEIEEEADHEHFVPVFQRGSNGAN